MSNGSKYNDWHSKELRIKIPRIWRRYYTKKIRQTSITVDVPDGGYYRRQEDWRDYDPYW